MLNVKNFKPFKGMIRIMFVNSSPKIGHSFNYWCLGYFVRFKVLRIKKLPNYWDIIEVKVTKVYSNKKTKLLNKQLRVGIK